MYNPTKKDIKYIVIILCKCLTLRTKVCMTKGIKKLILLFRMFRYNQNHNDMANCIIHYA